MTTWEKDWKVLVLLRTNILLVQHVRNKMSTNYIDINMNIKKYFSQILKPFSHICNVSFKTGVFPRKIAEVVPLFNSGEKSVFTTYNPISLLPQFSKILEKIYNDISEQFLNKYDVLSPSHYGFISMSTMSTHALLELVE